MWREEGAVPRADPLRDPCLDPSVIATIVAIPDIIERNHAITRGYHALSEAVAALLGRGDGNWCTFGQWASAEAGRAIRGESIPRLIRPILGPEIERAVADGNAAVFGDVGPPFARFVTAFRDAPAARRDPERADAVLAELCTWDELVGSPDLARAFRAYTDVLLLGDGTDAERGEHRAQRMLVANVSVGAAEQIVADPFVRAAIPGRSLLAVIATAHLGIHLPDATLALDRDVPAPTYLGGLPFPRALMELNDPDLLMLADRFDQDPSSAAHSHAPDWEEYKERVGFIFTFIRAYQQDPALFALPVG